jgi:hypothetical protein
MLVSVGPVGTAQTPRPFPSTRARSERKYGRFEIEYAGVSGEGAASAINDTLLIIAPLNRSSSGRKAWVTPQVPKESTARCCSSAARSLKSSE